MFQVYKSNRPERLVDALAQLVRQDPPGPFAPEWICVQSRGMDVWLAMQLADRLGIHALVESHFPRSLIEKVLLMGAGLDAKTQPRFEEERLTYAVLAALPGVLPHPELAELRAFLSDDPRGARRPQLARRIAGVFDRYTVFRPDLLARFETGQEAGWQAVLWNALPEALRSARLSSLAERVAKSLQTDEPVVGLLPKRVSLFGVSSLPPLFTRILAMLAEYIDVHLFVTSPSELFWADTVRGRPRAGTAPTEDGLDAERREVGHPLLSSFGKLSREFQDVLEDAVVYRESGESLFQDPGTGSLLDALQSDILHLRHRRADNDEAPPLPIAATDQSISIHDGHGPLREVEVLRDQLIDALEKDPTLEPEDIIVLTPDLETFGPLVQATFGPGRSGEPELPFRLSERPIRHGSTVNEVFASLLALGKKRCTSVEVLDFASLGPVRRRFGLEAEDLSLIGRWVRDSGIRFARDERHRVALEQPEERRNTWAFGFDRLFLGYAFPAERDRLFAGVSPYDEIEGSSAAVLGQFAELCDRLFSALIEMARPRTLAAWMDTLEDWLVALVSADGEDALSYQELRQNLHEMKRCALEAELTTELTLDGVEVLLSPRISEAISTHGFLAGGITVSELLPLRGIPFRVIALLGMSDTAFPRRPTPVSFDLVAQKPERGDRSVRDEDLQLFLETLLSARERLIITYSGQSPQDAASFPPSVVVGAMLDAIAEGFVPSGATPTTPIEARRSVEARLVTHHPLQAHSPRYFGSDPRSGDSPSLVSYDPRRREDAAALLGPRIHRAPFIDALLPAVETSTELALEALTRFFGHPARSFVKDRLGMKLELEDETLEEREALNLGPLESHRLLGLITEALRTHRPPESLLVTLRAQGLLPHGSFGELVLRDLLELEARPLAEIAGRLGPSEGQALTEIRLSISAHRLEGRVARSTSGGLFHFTTSRLKPKYRVAAWINHLALAAAETGRSAVDAAIVVGRGEGQGQAATLRFRLPADATALLHQFLLVREGAMSAPLAFFPRASFAYAERWAKTGGDRETARQAARSAWAAEERDDVYVAQLFSEDALFPPDAAEPTPFETLALELLGPMLEHTIEGPE